MDPADALRTARTTAGLSQAEVADRSGTSQATLSAYERGRKQPSVATLDRILRATGSRLAVEPGHARVRRLSRARAERNARVLDDVLALAAALPTRHDPKLRFPRLTARA